MKRLITLLFLVAVCYDVCSQNQLFVRVYDLTNKKIEKGYILVANDTLLRIKKKITYIDIPIKSIGTIKTKRSIGNNVLIGTIIGSSLVGGLGAATAEPDADIMGYTATEGATAGIIIGAPVGAFVGILTAGFKNSKKIVIDGDLEKWNLFLNYLSEKNKH